MSKNDVSSVVLSADDAVHLEREGAVSVPAQPNHAIAHPTRWPAGVIAGLMIGALLGLISLGLLGSGGTALWADRTQRDRGYVTTDGHDFSSAGSALVTERIHLGSAGTGWLYSPRLLDRVRIRVTPTSSNSALFVGIGPSAEVDRYLAGVSHTVISDFWSGKTEDEIGGAPISPPEMQKFWVASSIGPGTQTLTWDPTGGSWAVVVMNADGRPAILVEADLGARYPALPWIAGGLLVAGTAFAAGGTLLIVGALRRRRGPNPTAVV